MVIAIMTLFRICVIVTGLDVLTRVRLSPYPVLDGSQQRHSRVRNSPPRTSDLRHPAVEYSSQPSCSNRIVESNGERGFEQLPQSRPHWPARGIQN